MKVNIQRRVLPALLTLIIAATAVFGIAVPASAAVLDPYELADLVEADGANDKLYITFPEDKFYWRRYHDGDLGGVGQGNPFQYTTQMRWVDNDDVYFHPFGKDNFFPAEGLSNNALFDYNFRFWLSCANQTQDFSALGKLYLYARYKDGTAGSILVDETDGTKTVNQSSIVFFFTRVDKAIDLTNVESFNFYFAVYFSGVANENDTASVTVGCDGYFRLIFSLSAYYREVAAAGKTNSLIQEVQTQLAEQGKTFDDVLKETQQNGEKLDGIAGDIQHNGEKLDDVNDHLNDIYNGTQEGQDAADDFSDKAEQQGQQMGQMTDKLDSVEKPDITNVDFSLEALMDRFASEEFNFILRLLWNNDLIYQILLMSAILMLVSYILFGKKV